ncbi:MAG: class A beta-lactamase-related serine hydrolase [Deltaproteobacteria bacterium]|nr:MAG: class A beta-lactamase-related serine hydrolase [Deltaproteobacteria bacterium]
MSIHGQVAPGFERVREVFEENFRKRGEVGAALCVYRDGQIVVDLWGGVTDPSTGREWERDTPMVVFSATKGLVASRFLQLYEQGRFDPDAPVAEVWPEFARKGKEHITGRMLLNHRAGLSAIDAPLSLLDFVDPSGKVHDALVDQEPLWEPDTDQGYAATAYGPFVGELLYRLTGERFGPQFAEHVANPLGADVYSGAPDEVAQRAARLLPIGPKDIVRHHLPTILTRRNTEGRVFRRFLVNSTDTKRAFANPQMKLDELNLPEVRALDLPWMGALATAEGLARVYAGMIGEVDGVRLLDERTLRVVRGRQTWSQRDRVLHKPLGWSLGMLKEDTRGMFSPNPASFGHAGAGGSLGWADPDAGLAIGYVMNRMDWRIRSPRALALCQALYDCIERGA